MPKNDTRVISLKLIKEFPSERYKSDIYYRDKIDYLKLKKTPQLCLEKSSLYSDRIQRKL